MNTQTNNDTPNKKAVIYDHSATIEQDTSTEQNALKRLERRIAWCKSIAESQGYLVEKVFQDTGRSGNSLDRAGIISLLKYLERTKHPVTVILYEPHRLARGCVEWLNLKSAIEDAGGVVHVLNTTPEDQLIDRIIGAALDWQASTERGKQ